MQSVVSEVKYVGSFYFRGELGFLNCDDICMCVVNKQFELLEFVFNSVYVDLKNNEISLTFTAEFVRSHPWYVCEVVLVPYVVGAVVVMPVLLDVNMLRECECDLSDNS